MGRFAPGDPFQDPSLPTEYPASVAFVLRKLRTLRQEVQVAIDGIDQEILNLTNAMGNRVSKQALAQALNGLTPASASTTDLKNKYNALLAALKELATS